MNPDELILAIDVGSTWCKAAYVDRAGRIVASGEAWVRDQRLFGHDEAALDQVWQGVIEAVREAANQIGNQQPAAVAVAARKAPGIWLDGAGRAVGLPQDVVSAAGRNEIDACYASPVWGEDDPFAYGYGLDLIGNTRWLWRNHPEQWARLRRVGNLHSWLVYRLTGRWVTNHAGGPVQDAWPDAVRTLTGLPSEVFPTVFPDSHVLGQLHPRAAGEIGLSLDTPIVTGTHDGAAANIGSGALERGDACLTFGTNGVLRVITGERLPGRFGYTITNNRWALVRDLPDLALLLDGVVREIAGKDFQVLPEHHQELTAKAADVPSGANGLRLRLFPDSDGRTVEQAVAAGHDPVVIYRAALESVGLGFAGLVRRAREAGASPERFVVTGGAIDNELLIRITSACLAAPISVPDGEAGLVGLAALAATGAGWYATVQEAVDAMGGEHQTIEAAAGEVSAYREIVSSTVLPSGAAPGDDAPVSDRA
ncbi:FGGY family carbohydrate kinase [soil metagenome]